ncbi:hypothetical protein G7085_11685 [Tessaracoccus sp. HDW20]|uniref:hypothetical protein n=1 Tax=Tessaracoccus coleopterorum TaxID=2714950 RepID=UPI0018D37A63|nr:hypothetical protein [Tessaracoccus coleopterorum]NHB85049.1 hypothetical protein [Tessaracoccus coleopterorum]
MPQFATFSWADGPARPTGTCRPTSKTTSCGWRGRPRPPPPPSRCTASSSRPRTGRRGAGARGVVGVTRGTAGTVRLHQSGAVTYLAVWVNQGQTLLEATHAQPRLVGVSQIVWPPSRLTVQVTANQTVTALFTAPEGSRVEVQRFPKGATIAYDITRELDRAHVTTTGFRDLEPLMGEEIVYAAFCVAELADGSSRVSRPVTGVVRVTPDVEQVKVQVVRSTTTPGTYDISWLRPRHGEVRLYATQERPEQGIENEPRTLEIIEGQGRLTSEFRINYPPVDHGGLMTITGFAVDPSWVRAHFVAVHWVSDDAVWVGPIVSMVTPHAPTHGQVIERVDSQIVTFAWPEGSASCRPTRAAGPADRPGRLRAGGAADARPVREDGRDADHPHAAVQRVRASSLRRRVPRRTARLLRSLSIDYPGITRLEYQVIGYGADGGPAARACGRRCTGCSPGWTTTCTTPRSRSSARSGGCRSTRRTAGTSGGLSFRSRRGRCRRSPRSRPVRRRPS